MVATRRISFIGKGWSFVTGPASASRPPKASRSPDGWLGAHPERTKGAVRSGSPVDDSAGDQQNSRYYAGNHGDPSAPADQPVPEALDGRGGPLRSRRVPDQRQL